MRFHNLFIAISLLLLSNCGDDDKSPTGASDNPNDTPGLLTPLTTPEALMDRLTQAMRNRDIELYKSLLADRFWFTETDCTGQIVFANGLEEELEIMGGDEAQETAGIFDVFRAFDFEFALIEQTTELGSEALNAFDGDPDGHPDEDWEVFRGHVSMFLSQSADDGFRVEQEMSFKTHREGDEWKLVRWVDHPLAGECSDLTVEQSIEKGVKTETEIDTASWGKIKILFR